ncbi:hypothetical protein P167DRAFT_573111 [Morchella conica CCBAS932]|uniref:Uncharacterized protein n=1 Tax=Morchella conica CCBAS932 TaxID=1392247 RepID=A0A3N4KWM9_9PEZI|nr:hypothetical protein P167DRAFT_573111 [Morchella conica CCBAS932]
MRPSTFLPIHTLLIILSVLIVVALAGVMLYFTKVVLPTRSLPVEVAPKPPASDGSPSGGSRRTSGGSGLAPGSGSGSVASSSSDDTSSAGTLST